MPNADDRYLIDMRNLNPADAPNNPEADSGKQLAC